MKKLVNLITAMVIYFAMACIVEFTMGWGIENKGVLWCCGQCSLPWPMCF